MGDGWVLQGLKGGEFPFLLLIFFKPDLNKTELDYQLKKSTSSHLNGVSFQLGLRKQFALFKVIVSPCAAVLGIPELPQGLGFCYCPRF